MNWLKKHDNLKLLSIVFWLLFTVAFALWWFRFSIDNIVLLAKLQPEQLEHWGRQQRMVIWEGGTWLLLLILGGAALIGLVLKERRRILQIKEFFASFSHEIKTSLASLRLQAEALKDEHADMNAPILDRLIGDTVRLQLQLENSLFLASQDSLQLFLQSLSVDQLVERMREQWPGIEIQLQKSCVVRADERAVRTILSNLLQNAIVHGGANVIRIEVTELGRGRLQLSVLDNGSGFSGSTQKLGALFHRARATSGSGIGLFICRFLLAKMDGQLILPEGGPGFRVEMQLQGALT